MDRIHRMSRGRKTLLSLLLVGALGAVAGIGTFSAFSATTVNAGNTFDAGTVVISDNDANCAMYTIADAQADDVRRPVHPGDVHGFARVDGAPLRARPSARSDSTWTSPWTRAPARPVPELHRLRAAGRPIYSGTLGELRHGTHELANGRRHPGVQAVWNQNDASSTGSPDHAGQPAAQPVLDIRPAQLHVGGAERLDAF